MSTTRPGTSWATSTVLLHADGAKEVKYSHAADVAAPIGVSTTFERFEGGPDAHVYSRSTAPTRSRCESVLSALESGDAVEARATLFSSGLSAVHAALSALLKDSRRVLIAGGYHGTHDVLRELGCAVAPLRLDELRDGDVCWLESPKNPTGELADVEAFAEKAKTLKNCNVVVDATLAPLQRPLERGARLVVHSGTKYLAGHSDCLAGVVAARADDDDLLARLMKTRAAVGTQAGSLETWLLLRSLRTLELRVAQQTASAAKLADWLRTRTDVVRTVHHDGHSPLAPPRGVGGVFAIELHTEAQAKALPGALRLFKDATSIGGVESLAEWRRRYDDTIPPTLIRLSVGIEHVDDLIADFTHAFSHLPSSS